MEVQQFTYIFSRGGWCSKRSRLEKICISTLVITTAIIMCIVLLVLGIKKDDVQIHHGINTVIQTNSITTETEASKILKYVDPSINPCDNFYSFACGNHDFDISRILQDEEKTLIESCYKEPILDKDHNMVKVAKKLFKACMNESQIEMSGLETIKHVVESVGGWPVVEGSNWKEEDFDWLEVTYKLRKLGYEFNIFLDLGVVTDPNNSNRSILKVALPNVRNFEDDIIYSVDVMTGIAEAFGALYRDLAYKDMSDISYRFPLNSVVYSNKDPPIFEIGAYQQQCKIVNWLEFISNIVGTNTRLSETDLVIFPPPREMTNWLTRISSVSKRTHANYMLWKVIKASLPFLSIPMQQWAPRSSVCLEEVQKRFAPYSPIDVLFLRKYLPQHKKKAVEEIFSNIKKEFVAHVKKHVNWIDAENKAAVLERMETIQLIIGLPGDYISDQVLDDLNVDMVIPKNDNVLNLIAQANRNHQTLLYNYVTNHKGRKIPNLKIVKALPQYLENENIIFVPTISIKEALFNQNRSNYLNYGALGTRIALQFASILTLPLNSAIDKLYHLNELESKEKVQCLKNLAKKYKLPADTYYPNTMVLNNVGIKIAYKSYIKWLENHSEEKQLIGVEYTPNQIFWITSMLSFCKRDYGFNPYSTGDKYFPSSLMDSVRIVPEFAKDFNCSNEANMDASTKCELF